MYFRLVAITMFLAILHPASSLAHAARPVASTVSKPASNELIPASLRKPAPDFTLTDVAGRSLTLSRYRGRVVLLDFWATTCGGCKVEIPWYVEFDRRYRSKGLALLGIDMYGETARVIRPFMRKSHMDYPVAIGNNALGARFGVHEMPLTLLIDRNGRITVSHAGIVNKAEFEKDIQALLR